MRQSNRTKGNKEELKEKQCTTQNLIDFFVTELEQTLSKGDGVIAKKLGNPPVYTGYITDLTTGNATLIATIGEQRFLIDIAEIYHNDIGLKANA